MHQGRFVEMGTTADIFEHPQHIYTKRLLSAIPSLDVSQRDAYRARRKALERSLRKASWIITANKGNYCVPLSCRLLQIPTLLL